ncbi:MAG: hypothetical protein K1W40_07160, partial [Schaedlerella sp.]|uniref:hypothetical protein n=1 Tax=Schaedlerella sp. TaxID=2676057 RepID=UPI0035291955
PIPSANITGLTRRTTLSAMSPGNTDIGITRLIPMFYLFRYFLFSVDYLAFLEEKYRNIFLAPIYSF